MRARCLWSVLPALVPGAAAIAQLTPAAPRRPALVVFMAVDQMRGDYLQKYGAEFTGGLKKLLKEGAVFPNARQLHAVTETAPGHSTMMSGREPASTSIWSNDNGVPDASAPLIGSSRMGASPRRFVGTAFYDWLIAADSEAKLLSVSAKDRAAILPVGRAKGPVYWYADGRWTTSTYYADTLPTWLTQFNSGLNLARFAGRQWNLLNPADKYAEPDDQAYESGGREPSFPHTLPADGSRVQSAIVRNPLLDSLTLSAVLHGVQALKIGQHPGHTDYLSFSLSTLDAVGHAWGPDSRELHDHLLWLDRYLGAFFDSLATRVNPGDMIFAMTGDHGSYSLPEWRVAHGLPGGRANPAPWVDSIGKALDKEHGVPFGISFDNGLVIADVEALRARKVDVEELAARIEKRLAGTEGVARTWTRASLAQASRGDEAAELWRRSLPPTLGWLVAADAKPGWVFSGSTWTSEHGTHHPETINVPIVFLGAGIRPGIYQDRINTVDIAPTIAAIIGVTPLEKLDGAPVEKIVRQARPPRR
jgi:hypothetical protein